MQIEAIYDHGRLEFVTPVRLKRERLRLRVEVPDDAIDGLEEGFQLPPKVIAQARAQREALNAIRDATPPPDNELPELSDKQVQRFEAFARREDR